MAGNKRVSGTLLFMQVFLDALLAIVNAPRSTPRSTSFWMTTYVLICVATQIVGVRYWNRHAR